MGNKICSSTQENTLTIFGNYLDSDTRSLVMVLEYSSMKPDFREAYVLNNG